MRTFKCRGGLANDEPLQPELVHPLQRLLIDRRQAKSENRHAGRNPALTVRVRLSKYARRPRAAETPPRHLSHPTPLYL